MSSPSPTVAGAIGRALLGGLAGALLGLAFVGVGLLRFCAAGGSGARAASDMAQDARLLVFYVGGFGLAGALAGATQPYLPGRGGTFVRYALGGVVVTLAIGVAERGSLGALTQFDRVVLPLLGALFGCAFALGATQGQT